MADEQERVPHHLESASDRAHGTHGKGTGDIDSRETRVDPTPTGAGNADDAERLDASPDAKDEMTSQLSGSGWGSGAAGGSVADKRSPTTERDREQGTR